MAAHAAAAVVQEACSGRAVPRVIQVVAMRRRRTPWRAGQRMERRSRDACL
jgi:hypothetical protein